MTTQRVLTIPIIFTVKVDLQKSSASKSKKNQLGNASNIEQFYDR